MAARNRTLVFKRYRDALKTVRIPTISSVSSSSGSGSGTGPVIELVGSSLLQNKRRYTPLSSDDPGNSRYGVLDFGFISLDLVIRSFVLNFNVGLFVVL